MASKSIKGSEVIEQGFLDPSIKNVKALEKELGDLDKGLNVVYSSTVKLLKLQKDPKNSKDIKELNATLKKSKEARKGLLEVEKQQVVVKKKLKELTVAEIKDKLKLQARNKAIRDSLKDVIILEQKQVGTLQRIAIENKRLRKEREKLNLDTEKGRLRLKAINKELDKNNKKVSENSDKLKKQKLNVGNYADSIKEAAGASGLFGGVLGKLAAIQGTLSALTKKNTVEEEVNTVAKESNAAATVHVTTAQRAMNASVAMGTKGLKLFKVALAGSGIGLLLIAVGGLVSFFTRAQEGIDGISTSMAGISGAIDVFLDRFSTVGKAITLFFSGDFSEAVDLIKTSFSGVVSEMKEVAEMQKRLKELTIELTRNQNLFNAQQATTITKIKELTVITKNKLAADQDRLKAVKEINDLEISLTERQLELQKEQLAASLESVSADGARLQLTKEELQFVEDIKAGRVSAADAVEKATAFTLSTAGGEAALFEILEKVVELEQAKQSLLDKQATTAKRTASITQQIANKKATELLQEAALQKEIAKDVDLSTEKRAVAFKKAGKFETDAYRARFEANIINFKEFEALRLKLIKVAEGNIQKLLAAVEKERLRKIKAAEEARIKGLEDIAKDMDAEVQTLETQLFRLETIKLQGVDNAEEIAAKELDIEREKLENLKNSQLAGAEDIAQAQAEFDRFKIEKAQKLADELADIDQKKTEKALNELSQITAATGSELQKRSDAEQRAINADIKRNADAISTQEQLARDGKENTLAFEKAQADKLALAQKDALEKAERQQEIVQITEAYWNALNARLSQPNADPNQAPALAAKDVFLAKGIAKGLVQFAATGNDMVEGAGTTTSDSIPFMLSKNEGVVHAAANVGNSGAVAALNNGSFSNMYIKKSDLDSQKQTMSNAQNALLLQSQKETNELLKSIKSKPVQQVNVDELGNLIEVVYNNGRKTAIKHVSNKKRFH